jgi:biopolymer transport protein ExbB
MDMDRLIDGGGPIVLILLGLSVVSIAIGIAKSIQIIAAGRGQNERRTLLSGVSGDGWPHLPDATGPCWRVLQAAFANPGLSPSARRAAAEAVARGELVRLRSYLRVLDVVAVTSPLVGLLGTVTGMIAAFQALEAAGGGANAAVLSGGIWQALLTTAAGLIVAIPAAAAVNLLEARVETIASEMESIIGSACAEP